MSTTSYLVHVHCTKCSRVNLHALIIQADLLIYHLLYVCLVLMPWLNNSNIITMAKETLHKWVVSVCVLTFCQGIVFLSRMYCLRISELLCRCWGHFNSITTGCVKTVQVEIQFGKTLVKIQPDLNFLHHCFTSSPHNMFFSFRWIWFPWPFSCLSY